MNYTRKTFLKTVGLGTGAIILTPFTANSTSVVPSKNNQKEGQKELTIGIASYTLRKHSLDEVLTICTQLNIKDIAFKSMHMPMNSTDEELKTIAKKVSDAGINLYGAGVIYMKTKEDVENAFRYAKAANLKVIIGVPNHDLLELVEKKVKETDIKLAIHNHGPGDKVYPTPESVYEKIKHLDKRMGLCIDIGHVKRLGLDPSENLIKYADRLYDMHLKDVDRVGAEGKSVELGRGIIDIPKVLKTLKKINYTGIMGLEYEKSPDNVLPGLSECLGYANAVIDIIES